jgi:squalene-associated FAD-dependent desaturase
MKPVVVIGGGFAGLSAAVALAARGRRVLVLEARPHLGGRAYSFTDAETGDVVDNGQHALMGCYRHTLEFLEQIGAGHKLFCQPDLRVHLADGARGTGRLVGAPLPSPLHMLAAIARYRLLTRRERLSALLGGLRFLLMYRRREPALATATLDDVLTALGQSANARASFWYPVAVATLNERPERAAAAPFAEVLARAFFASRADSRFVLPAVGLSELYTHDAHRFLAAREGRVELRAPVTELLVTDERVAAVRLRDGRCLEVAACISTVPPRALAAVLPEPLRARPPFAALTRFTSSPIVSVHLWLDRAVLDEAFLGLIGTTTQWLFSHRHIRTAGNGADHVPAPGHALSAVISAAHDVVQWPNEDIIARVWGDLRALVPAARAARLLHARIVKEKDATISNTLEAERLRPPAETPLGNLFLAGDWTATGLPPTIESAVLSGRRAAALAATRLAA